MIDLKLLREDPRRFINGARDKQSKVDIDRLLELDAQVRRLQTEQQELAAEKNRIGKDIGALAGRMKKADVATRAELAEQMTQLQQKPAAMKQREAELGEQIQHLIGERDALWMLVPQPADADVPVGVSADDNVELRCWQPEDYDPKLTFLENRGFVPKSHIELMTELKMVDFERGVKMSGARSYVLTNDGMRLHQAILQYAFHYMVQDNGFTPVSVPVLVRDEMMVGTGFFPHGRDQAYQIGNPTAEGEGFSLTGTGEVGLMGLYADEILDYDLLPLTMTTVSTCFRREAGAAGKDTAGLFRIHQFDKVEQVVICKADEQESRAWHKTMIGFVETLLQRLKLPYRLLQCCTGDLGPKNADMIDLECWMPSRGELDKHGVPQGAYAETHSASRLYDYQCRRLNMRYRDPETQKTVFCHSLNNTVAASPRILIPIVEMYQNADGSIDVPDVLQPYMGGKQVIGH